MERRGLGSVDVARRTRELDAISARLVLIDRIPLAEVRSILAEFDGAVRDHLARAVRSSSVIDEEHERFRVSLEQLAWFLRVVESDDHGGNRQALGQYGRVVAEAMRRHLADEGLLPSETDGPAGNAK